MHHTHRYNQAHSMYLKLGEQRADIYIDTEIDFFTYMEHARAVFQKGIRDYNKISGPSGPIAYPAGYLYIFEGIRRFTGDGQSLPLAQALFATIYVIQLTIVFLIYWTGQIPFPAFLLATLSKRLHSIFVLRLFNDCVTMTLMHGCILALMRRKWFLGVALYAVALSTKMNVLLFYPAILLICLRETGWGRTLALHALIPLFQVIVGAPFLLNNATAYVKVAFDLDRRFEWTWTVNWRFLGESLFKALQASRFLMVAQLVAILLWANFIWLRSERGIAGFLWSRRRDQVKMGSKGALMPTEIGRWLFQANLLGIILCKSLHYQFYSWYCWSLPYLLLVGGTASWSWSCAAFIFFAGIEYCWNVFPSTAWSSILLLILNIVTLVISDMGEIPRENLENKPGGTNLKVSHIPAPPRQCH